MSFELKRKDIVRESGYKFAIGYCGMQYLLRYQNKLGYTRGTYGWNCDVYRIDDCIITTGYRGMVGKSIDYNLLREYELKAEELQNNILLPYEGRRDMVNTLLYELLDKAKEDY